MSLVTVRAARTPVWVMVLVVGLAFGLVVLASPREAASADAPLQALEPARLLDTRSGESTFDGLSEGAGRVAAGETIEVRIAGRGGVPNDVTAALVNVTAVRPSSGGYLTVYPCDAKRPTASSVNYRSGETVANAVLAKLSSAGYVCIYSEAATDLLLDVSGYVPDGGTPEPVTPARLLETRVGPDFVTTDGLFRGAGRVAAGSVTEVRVTGRGGVPSGAAAVFVNVTAVNPGANGYLTVYSCDAGRPLASHVNYRTGDVVPNAVLTQAATDGTICIYTVAATHLLVDVGGYVPAGGSPEALVPARLLETRVGADKRTTDGLFEGVGRRSANTTIAVTVAGRGGVPIDATSVLLNVTAVQPSGTGYLTVYPCGTLPLASNVNYRAGQVVPNAVLAQLDDDGQVCIYSVAATDLVVDVVGASTGEPFASYEVVDTSTAPSTTAPSGSPPAPGGAWTWISYPNPLVRWDPCAGSIRFAIDQGAGTPAQVGEVFAAIAEIEYRTGLDFAFAGSVATDFYVPVNGSPDTPQPYIPSGADVVIVIADESVIPAFTTGTLGYTSIGGSTTNGEITDGVVVLDATPIAGIPFPAVVLHELGHLVGLGHVTVADFGSAAATELMQPYYQQGLDTFGPGDLEGLWRVGRAQGCLLSTLTDTDDGRFEYTTADHDHDHDASTSHADVAASGASTVGSER